MTSETRTVGRRERLRTQTLQEIEDASFAIIDADGGTALSIAELARSLAMSAPAVYRYFPSRDALVQHLINRSYEQFVAALRAAAEGSRRAPRARLRSLVAAYRDWALQHRRRYAMLFGQRSGDLPPDAGPRTPMDEAMALLIDLLTSLADGPGDPGSGDRTLDAQLRVWARDQQRPETTPLAARTALVIWTRVHGIVSLELTGMLDGQPVDAQRLIDLEVDSAVRLLAPGGALSSPSAAR